MGKILTKILKKFGDNEIFDRSVPNRRTLTNGSIITFDYQSKGRNKRPSHRGERFGLVVIANNQSGRVGGKLPVWYCMGTSNELVNVIRLNNHVSLVIDFISQKLKESNNKKGITTKQLSGLEALIGRGNFRTYKISKMTNMYVLDYIPREGSPKKIIPKKNK